MDSLQPTILIVDDEKHTRDGLRRLLEDDYDTYVAEDIRGAMDVLEREQIDLMITDLRLGGDDGMALIERALKLPHPPISIMMTAYGTVDTPVELMKRGLTYSNLRKCSGTSTTTRHVVLPNPRSRFRAVRRPD
jgi:DNA-binding NtrC family response regulator